MHIIKAKKNHYKNYLTKHTKAENKANWNPKTSQLTKRKERKKLEGQELKNQIRKWHIHINVSIVTLK